MDSSLETFKERLEPQIDHIMERIASGEIGTEDIRFYILGIAAETWSRAYAKGANDQNVVYYEKAASEARAEALKGVRSRILKLILIIPNFPEDERSDPRLWLGKLDAMLEGGE